MVVADEAKKLEVKLSKPSNKMREIGAYTPLTKDPKKLTTKLMIEQALADLTLNEKKKSVSFYALRKYIVERFNVDKERINYFLKKSIKTAVETGLLVQTKGIGASGSFKLAPKKVEKKPKKPKASKDTEEKATKKTGSTKTLKELESLEKLLAEEEKAKKKAKKSSKSSLEEKIAQMNKMPVKIRTEKEKGDKKTAEEKKTKDKGEKKKIKKKKVSKLDAHGGGEAIKKKSEATKVLKTPKKKKTNLKKRQSIGSVVKPPKMKPKKVVSQT